MPKQSSHAPERATSYRSDLTEIEQMARVAGLELEPFQKRFIDWATEYRLNDEGERVYRYSLRHVR